MIWCKRGVFVYVISKPITTAIMLIAELSGHAKDGIFAIGKQSPPHTAPPSYQYHPSVECLPQYQH